MEFPEEFHSKMRIVENGIKMADVPSSEIPRKIEKILLISRLDPRKGQMYLLQAAKELQKTNPELKFFIDDSMDYAERIDELLK